MQVSVESKGGLKREMTVQVPSDRIEREVDSRLRSLSKKAKLPGFRPGKVPMKVIRKRYGRDVRNEVLTELMRSSYAEALGEKEIRPAGGPQIDPVTMEPGKDLEYKATFEVYPEPEVKGLEGETVEKPVAEVTDGDVDDMVEKLRRQHAEWKTVERAAKEGDRVVIDFEGDIKGEPFPGNKAEKTPVELGAGRLLGEFEEQLTGAGAGQDLEVKVKFPKDYHSEELQGKKARFQVKVHEVQEQELPEVDDEFCRMFGVEEGGVDKLREEVRANMVKELEETIRRKIKEQVMDKLLERNEIELPEALVEEEIGRLKQDQARQMGLSDPEHMSGMPREIFEEQARRRVALGLLVGEIIKAEELEPEDGRVDEILESIAAGYQDGDEVKKQYRANPQVMNQIESMALEDQVVDRLLDSAEVKEKPTSFSELMDVDSNGR